MNQREKYIRLFKAIGKIQYLYHENTMAYQLAEVIRANCIDGYTDIDQDCLSSIEQMIEEMADHG